MDTFYLRRNTHVDEHPHTHRPSQLTHAPSLFTCFPEVLTNHSFVAEVESDCDLRFIARPTSEDDKMKPLHHFVSRHQGFDMLV